jgi:spore coat protein CotF
MNQNQNQTQNQQQMTIKNPKPPGEPKVKGPEMNDRDRINDILTMEKYLTDSFNVSAREASHESYHQDVMTVLNETHRCQYEMFEMMFKKGHYKLEAEPQSSLDQAFKQFSGYSSQFPYQTTTLQ